MTNTESSILSEIHAALEVRRQLGEPTDAKIDNLVHAGATVFAYAKLDFVAIKIHRDGAYITLSAFQEDLMAQSANHIWTRRVALSEPDFLGQIARHVFSPW
jgi:hypothetical protein